MPRLQASSVMQQRGAMKPHSITCDSMQSNTDRPMTTVRIRHSYALEPIGLRLPCSNAISLADAFPTSALIAS